MLTAKQIYSQLVVKGAAVGLIGLIVATILDGLTPNSPGVSDFLAVLAFVLGAILAALGLYLQAEIPLWFSDDGDDKEEAQSDSEPEETADPSPSETPQEESGESETPGESQPQDESNPLFLREGSENRIAIGNGLVFVGGMLIMLSMT